MGLLDAPVVSTAKVGAVVTAMLANNQQNVNLQVVSDSTGVYQNSGDPRWVYLLGEYLGSLFPAYTVNYRQWNDTTQSYDAAVVIQVGTGTGNGGGPYVLEIYNASKGGANAAYWLARMFVKTLVFPVVPDLILLSDGHNEVAQTGDVARSSFYTLIAAIQSLNPGCSIALVTQNPQNAAGSSSSSTLFIEHVKRMTEIRKLARTENLGLIDVEPAFFADANYATDYIIADGVHPTASGSALWASEVEHHFPAIRDRFTPPAGGPGAAVTRHFIDPSRFVVVTGTPTLVIHQNVPAWSMPAGADSVIACSCDWPANWRSVFVNVIWTDGTTSTNPWRCRFNYSRLTGTLRAASSGLVLGSQFQVGSLNTLPGLAVADTVSVSRLSGQEDISAYAVRPVSFQLERKGDDAADTLATPVYILGIVLDRGA